MPKEKVRLAIMAPTLNLCNYLFAINRGYFLKEGLEVEVVIRPGRRNTDAIVTGDVDFGAANECVIQAALEGHTELKILLQVLKDPLHDLIVSKDIENLQDLKGKRVAVPGPGSTPTVQSGIFFRNNGLIPGQDVFLVVQDKGETMLDRIRKFEKGEYSGVIASPPTPLLLHKKGFRSLTELSLHFPGSASHGLIATTDTIDNRGPIVEAMVRGFVRGVTTLKRDRKDALDFIVDHYQLEPSIAAQSYDLLKDRWTAELSLDSLRSEIDFQSRLAGVEPVSPESIMDDRYTAIR